MKEVLRTVISRAVVLSGLTALGRRLFPKRGALIFYGHRVAADDEGYLPGLRPEWLDEQLTYLTRHYAVIRLSELLRCFEERRPVPERSVVLTFDDGFRDNLLNGLPVLRRHGVSATFFLATGCVSRGELPWPQQLGYLFQHTRAARAVLDTGPVRREFDLGNPAARRRAYLAFKQHLLPLPRTGREACLASWSRQLGVEAPRDRMLSWEDVKAMQAAGMEFGAHTWSHPHLAHIPFEEARWEIERSRDDLREQLGLERPPFCFPAGSYNARLMALVPALGLRSVFQPNPPHRVNTLENAHPFGLGRLGLPNAPAVYLEAELDGPLPVIRRLWRRPRPSARPDPDRQAEAHN